MSHGGGQFDVGGSLGGGKSGELMAEVVEVVVGDIGAEEHLRPRFLDVEGAESGFGGED